ncbi:MULTISPECIES: glycosyltransferase family 2 protein [Empedobacter]|uniref:Glycosyltransferase family 2 protein n=1 Tax=Empedobacter falsenii TaxID=343874 RepID=A0A7H9DP22_9FLAO|nr:MULTISPECIES: glycosyltransferase family 2 protein [Empedobacter]QLL56892.1 glycosyltransferase family 2 protein [Empedobacter falsenii]
MKNELAIIIPYYKIDFFEQTLQSISKQTDKRFSLYIGNDASPNDPLPIINKYLKSNEFKYFDYKENLGGENLALQWERILENVTEEWFQILGDDDMISDNFVEEFYRNIDKIKRNKINVIKVSQVWIDESDLFLNEITSLETIIDAKKHFLIEYNHQFRSSLSEHLFHRNEFYKYGFKKFPLAWHSDNLAVYETSNFSKIYFINNALVRVRMSDVNISNRSDDLQIKLQASHLYREYILLNYLDFLPKKLILEELRKYREYIWKNKLASNISLFKSYLKIGEIRKALGSLKY